MALEKIRPISMEDEIRMHLLLWNSDSTQWNKLPLGVRQALYTALNEYKVADALKAYGTVDDRTVTKSTSDPVEIAKREFMALFRKEYQEYCDAPYEESVDKGTLFICRTQMAKLLKHGATAREYINWFFHEFMTQEFNKKAYAPPAMETALREKILAKYLFESRDKLRIRQETMRNAEAKNAVMTLALQFLESTHNREFGDKILKFSHGEINLRKFSEIFLNVLITTGNTELYTKMKELINGNNS